MIQTKGLSGAQTMLRVLGEMGVERIFASPGSEWSPVWEALAEPGVERMPLYLSTRHEEVAVGMASGVPHRARRAEGAEETPCEYAVPQLRDR